MFNKFTFGIVSYNQEAVVTETLDSIKYQIKKFGIDIAFSIVFGDDGSSDNTVAVIENWLADNKDLFDSIIILPHLTNQGTVQNFLRVLDNIYDEYFKIMAADDLFSCENMFKKFDLLDKYDIVSFYPLGIKNGSVIDCANDYLFYLDMKQSKYQKLIRWQNYFIMPQTIYKKTLITDEIRSFLSRFDLLEDYPLLIKVFETANVKCKFMTETLSLYRISTTSVSHSWKLNKRYLEDRLELERYLIKTSKNSIEKFYHAIQRYSYKRDSKLLQPIYYINKLRQVLHKIFIKLFVHSKLNLDQRIKQNQCYYDELKTRPSDKGGIYAGN